MKYRKFGKTGYNVSAMTLGTWGMGGAGWDTYDEDVKADAVKAALEQGVNIIDTAPAYNAGAAEQFLGRTLKKLGVRDDFIIVTKCGNYFDNNAYIRDGSPERVRRQCEDSLRNLQTDHIDVMLIHWPDPKTPFEETMDVLNRLKKEGKILHLGVSNFSIEQMQELSRYGEIEVYQPQYSMINPSSEPVIRWAAEQGLGVMSYGSLGGGMLTGKIRQYKEYEPTDNRSRFYKLTDRKVFASCMELLQVMDQVSERRGGIPLSQIALAWSWSRPFISTCIAGAQKRERVIENARAFDFEIAPEDLALLDSAVDRLFR